MTALSPREVAEKCAEICDEYGKERMHVQHIGPAQSAAAVECAMRIERLAATLPVDGWVSVKERLPEKVAATYGDLRDKSRYVLAVDAKGRMSIGYALRYASGDVHWIFAKQIGEVTHWMPLPAEPKETK